MKCTVHAGQNFDGGAQFSSCPRLQPPWLLAKNKITVRSWTYHQRPNPTCTGNPISWFHRYRTCMRKCAYFFSLLQLTKNCFSAVALKLLLVSIYCSHQYECCKEMHTIWFWLFLQTRLLMLVSFTVGHLLSQNAAASMTITVKPLPCQNLWCSILLQYGVLLVLEFRNAN